MKRRSRSVQDKPVFRVIKIMEKIAAIPSAGPRAFQPQVYFDVAGLAAPPAVAI
jgi:hypothetical protein